MPPPTMATLKVLGLEDSVVGALVVAVIVRSVLVVLEAENVVVVEGSKSVGGFNVICVNVKDQGQIGEVLLVLLSLKVLCLQKEGQEAGPAACIYTQNAGRGPAESSRSVPPSSKSAISQSCWLGVKSNEEIANGFQYTWEHRSIQETRSGDRKRRRATFELILILIASLPLGPTSKLRNISVITKTSNKKVKSMGRPDKKIFDLPGYSLTGSFRSIALLVIASGPLPSWR